jgi:hypothetical protein
MPSKAFKLAEAMVSNPVMSDMVENPTATPTQIAAVETKTSAISDTGVISVNTKNIVSNNVLTQSFDSNQVVGFNLTDSIDAVSPIMSVFKEVPQAGFSSKGQWDVNANATNYDFYDEKPLNYNTTTLTPSATGNGTFTSSSPIVVEFDVANMAYNNKSYDFSTQTTQPEGGGWGNNGTVFFMCTNAFNRMYSYTASTAYDISTLTYDNKYLAISSPYSDPCDVIISDDGTKFWGTGRSDVIVGEFVMSTAFDLSTATYNNSSLDMSAQLDGNCRSISFGDNGTKLYATGFGASYVNPKIVQYNLSTAYDLSTATYSGNSITYQKVTTAKINADGTKMLIATYRLDEVYLFTLSTAYDLSTATDSGISYNFSSIVNTINNSTCGGTTNPDGSEFYFFGGSSGTDGNTYQFNMGGSKAFNSADVGKKVVGNSGSAIITGTSGTYQSVTAFADTSAISSWQLFGAQGKADGSGIELSGYTSGYDISSLSLNNTLDISTVSVTANGGFFKPDGTVLYFHDNQADTIIQYPLTTAWDLSTVGNSTGNVAIGTQDTNIRGPAFSTDGTKMYALGYTNDRYYQYTLSTAWDVTSASYSNKSVSFASVDVASSIMHWKSDGTSFFSVGTVSDRVRRWDLTTAWDISTASNVSSLALASVFNIPYGVSLNPDGTKMYIVGRTVNTTHEVRQYSLSTAFDITTATYDNISWDYVSDGGQTGVPEHLFFGNSGTRLYLTKSGANITEWNSGSSVAVYSTYSPALTNSSTGQINSSSWLDINSMTADETKNGGDIFYAVSTDNRASWGVAKASDGVRKIARNNSGTWQYNNDGGSSTTSEFSLSSPSYESEIKLDTGTGGWNSGWPANSVAFNNDGTKMYGIINAQNAGQNPAVYEFSLSTAYDVSTASYTTWINVQPNTGNRGLKSHVSLQFSPNGQYMYVNSSPYDHLSVYTLSTAWDISTASHTRNVATTGFSTGYGGFVTSNGIIWKGALGNVQDLTFQTINDYSLSSVGSAQYISGAFGSFNPETLVANADATKIFIHTGNTGSGSEGWVEYTRSSSGAISTSDTLTQTNVWNHGLSYDPKAGQFSVDGTKMIIATDVTGGKGARVFSTTGTILSYGTSETWVNGTNNNEHATLQEALGAQSFNRMDKAQLDAVADGYHFSQDSADTLDLMIAPYAASGSSPISDGVTINYDAEAIVREAIPGTDYIADFPNNTTINIKSLVNTNMKVRAL